MIDGYQCHNKSLGNFAVHCIAAEFRAFCREFHIRISIMEFLAHICRKSIESAYEAFDVIFLHIDNGIGITCDGVFLVAALHLGQLEVSKLGIEESGHNLDRIRSFLINVVAAMSADCIEHSEFYRLESRFHRLSCVVECSSGVKTACAADKYLSLILGIQIKQCLGLDKARLDGIGTVHSGLLRDGEQTFDFTGIQVACEQCQCCCNTDSVISAEGSFLGNHPSVFDNIVDRVSHEIVPGCGSLLADHILMALECDGRHVFLAFRSFFGDYYITCSVCSAAKAMLFSKILKKGCHFFFMTGLPRNLGDLAENFKYRIGIHIQLIFNRQLQAFSQCLKHTA